MARRRALHDRHERTRPAIPIYPAAPGNGPAHGRFGRPATSREYASFMAKSQKKSGRETKKLKAETGKAKSKGPRYLADQPSATAASPVATKVEGKKHT